MYKYILILLLFGCAKPEPITPVVIPMDAKLSFFTSYDHGGGDMLLYLNGEYKGKIRAIQPNLTCNDGIVKTIQLNEGLNEWYVVDYEGNTWSGEITAINNTCTLIDLWIYNN